MSSTYTVITILLEAFYYDKDVNSDVTDKPISIGVMTIATNIYLEYWKSMVLSADEVTNLNDNVTLFVFTDNFNEIEDFKGKLKNVKVRAVEIPPYRWPEATLLRYLVFNTYKHILDTEILVHLDADMILKVNPWTRIKSKLNENSICLVSHPGYWRPRGYNRIFLYLSHPLLALRDVRLKIKLGGIGAWETNNSSNAFVGHKFRRSYVCGGIWFGKRTSILDLVDTLSSEVQRDLDKNIIATWHDESHLNRWSVENSHGFEIPELCFDETYSQLKKLTPYIIAVRKIEKTRE